MGKGGGDPICLTESAAFTAALSMVPIMLAFRFTRRRLLGPALNPVTSSSLPEDCTAHHHWYPVQPLKIL